MYLLSNPITWYKQIMKCNLWTCKVVPNSSNKRNSKCPAWYRIHYLQCFFKQSWHAVSYYYYAIHFVRAYLFCKTCIYTCSYDFHPGLDIYLKHGTPLYTIDDGKVINDGDSSGIVIVSWIVLTYIGSSEKGHVGDNSTEVTMSSFGGSNVL